MPESYSEQQGWDDDRLRSANENFGTRINRVELDVLLATKEGHGESIEATAEATGLTVGQVSSARMVLAEQGLAERVA